MENEELPETARFAPGSMDYVLSEIENPDVRERILRIAHESGIHKEDPVWSLILLVQAAQDSKEWAGKAAQAAGDAADRVRDAIHSLPEKIRESVGAGVEAVKETVGTAGVEAASEIKTAGITVGRALVEAIRKESETFKSELNLSAKSKKEETLEELKSDLSSAVNSAMKTRFTSTLLISVLLILATIIGTGAAGYVYGKKLTPNSCVSGENFFSERGGKHWCVRRIP
ncbi:hypothetical protein ABH19_06620 [Leptospirillum sp. Group II 'CF-1']|jgi:hypothetical protein|uniref:hypothetical protein n=1 Tax=Leptospirillum sp. Group II 'CF-1' TaxID=1660083 RepID=UPI0006727697|nr:hypothetical protein [Leptospirillum sp. Group II 'CF-1']AKS23491.1 hypothetical protein ABH19_06620 [Leptospirillum sp. Group II 'CF-1']